MQRLVGWLTREGVCELLWKTTKQGDHLGDALLLPLKPSTSSQASFIKVHKRVNVTRHLGTNSIWDSVLFLHPRNAKTPVLGLTSSVVSRRQGEWYWGARCHGLKPCAHWCPCRAFDSQGRSQHCRSSASSSQSLTCMSQRPLTVPTNGWYSHMPPTSQLCPC